MLPMMCLNCQSKIPGYNGIFHGRDFLTPCPACGGQGKPVAIIHLQIPCDSSDAHPDLVNEFKFMGQSIPPQKIACGFGPRLPRHLTSLPIAATCFQCLKVYRQLHPLPDNSESPQ